MKNFLIFLLVTATSLCYSQSNYNGVGFQKDINESWDLSLKKIDDKSFKVNYPSIPCTATWTIVRQENNYKVYKEKLTSGFDKCKDDGYIFLVNDTFSKSTKRFYIFDHVEDKNPSAYGFLEIDFR